MPAMTARIETVDRSISPTATICRWSPPTRRSSPTRDDYDAHDALIAIAEGSVVAADNRRRLTPDNYLQSQAEMAALFADLPEAIDNTVEIARRCSYCPKTRKPILPRFTGGDAPMPTRRPSAPRPTSSRRQAREGLDARLADARA